MNCISGQPKPDFNFTHHPELKRIGGKFTDKYSYHVSVVPNFNRGMDYYLNQVDGREDEMYFEFYHTILGVEFIEASVLILPNKANNEDNLRESNVQKYIGSGQSSDNDSSESEAKDSDNR